MTPDPTRSDPPHPEPDHQPTRSLPPGAPDVPTGAFDSAVPPHRAAFEARLAALGGLDSTRDGTADPGATAAVPPIPGYELLGELGRGGMGVVFEARELALNRTVALKMVLAGPYADPSTRARFLIEAESVAAVQHPHIVQVFAFGEHAGHPYLAMEHLSGGTLADRVRVRGPLPPTEAACVAVKLAGAMAAAHAAGVVHRDLKPQNVLLGATGEPKVTDFGLAKVGRSDVTATGAILGTPSYMAPEQAAGKTREVGTAADVYGLGAILYDLLTGRPPFKGDSQAATIQMVLTAEPARPRTVNAGIPRDLETVCLKCLEKDTAKRYPTAEALADDLGRFLRGEPVLARRVGKAEQAWRWCGRNRAVASLLAAALFALVLGAVVSTWQATRAEHARDRAVASQRALRSTLSRQVADHLEADLLRLSAVGEALAATLEQGNFRDEKRLIEWKIRMLKGDPHIGGLSVSFEPDTFDLRPDLRHKRLRAPLPFVPPHVGPDRDGYTLYVYRRRPSHSVVSEPLALEYNYRSRDWYQESLRGRQVGWCEPGFDAYSEGRPMVSFVGPVRGSDGLNVGVLTVELSLEYFERLSTLLNNPIFGPESYGFVLSGTGRVIGHPRVRLAGKEGELCPKIVDLLGDSTFGTVVEMALAHSGDSVGEATGTDPATGRRSLFLYSRLKPAGWVFVAVVPEERP